PGLKLAVLGAYFAVTAYLEAAVSATVLWGGALYVPTLLLMLVIGMVLYRRRLRGAGAFLAAMAVFLASFSARTLDARLCSAFPVGTHFIWHLLNATLLFILVRADLDHVVRGQSRSDRQHAPLAIAHGLDRIAHQVKYDLLDLHTVEKR